MRDPTHRVNECSPAWFTTTHWTVVLDAGCGEIDRRSAALSKLCQAYWRPIYAYVRRLGRNPADAEDLTQGFFARMIEKNYIESVDAEKGRFRSFLLTAVKRFLANEWNTEHRLKRGGGWEIVSLDSQHAEERLAAEMTENGSPEKHFEREWAMTLLEQVLSRLESEFSNDGKAELFDRLKTALLGEKADRSYAEVGRELGLSAGAIKVTVFRMRRRYRELLREEIACTVSSSREIDEELRHLFVALNS